MARPSRDFHADGMRRDTCGATCRRLHLKSLATEPITHIFCIRHSFIRSFMIRDSTSPSPLSLLSRPAYNLPPMSVIEIRGLAKSYRVYLKKEGLWAAIQGLFHREYREVEAVRGIDLDVDAGEF